MNGMDLEPLITFDMFNIVKTLDLPNIYKMFIVSIYIYEPFHVKTNSIDSA